MKKILTFGVYDMLHIGHMLLFKRAKELGDYLIVAVQDGECILKYKPGTEMIYSTDERLYAFYQALWKMLQADTDKAVADLQDFLPRMSEQGSHDDISIAGVLCKPLPAWRRLFMRN